MKHTPGPWAIWQGWGAKDIAIRPVIGGRTMTLTLARVFTESVTEKQEALANARLIAAAPELLEALKDSYPYIDNDALRKRIGSALAKAEGFTA